MNDLIKRLRARTVPMWTHATCGTPVMHGHKPDPLCLEAADRLDQIRVLVEAVRAAVRQHIGQKCRHARAGVHEAQRSS